MRNKLIGIVAAGVFLTAVLLYYEERETVDYKRHVKKAAKNSIATKEDPYARFNFELSRTIDPETGMLPEKIRKRELAFAAKLPVKGEFLGSSLEKKSVVSTEWQLRGPFNVGGRTRALAIDVTDEDIILAGGVSGGMWYSDDGGSSWFKTTQPEQIHSATCLTQDTRQGKTDTWYYGTGEAVGNSATKDNAWYSGDGIFKSTDGGLSWDLLPSTSTNRPEIYDNYFDYVWNMAVDPSNANQDEIYAAVSGGIFRSTNGGENWSAVKVSSTSNWAYYTDLAVTSDGVVYATLSSEGASDAGIWRSADGTNWTDITPSGWPSAYRRTVIGIAPSDENIVYFLSETPGSGTQNHSLWKYTYQSGDGSGSGGIWENRSSAVPSEGGFTGDFSSQSSYDLVIAVKPDNEDVVFIGGINLYRSDNGFQDNSQTQWIGGYVKSNDSYASYPNHHADQHSLFFYPSDPGKLLSGHDGGISYTADCMSDDVNWEILNRGYFTAQYYTVALDPTGNDNIIVGGTQDNGTWFLNNSSSTADWNWILGGDGAFCAIAPDHEYYYTSFQNGEIYRLELNSSGNYTTYAARIDPEGGESYLFINPFILDPNVPERMYLAGGSYIWRNSDVTVLPEGGDYTPPSQNWTKLLNSEIPAGKISALEISRAPSDRLYYGTSQGALFRIDGAQNGDPEPQDIRGDGFPDGYINCIAIDPGDADHALVVFSNYQVVSIWVTHDGGGSWTSVSGNLEENTDGSGSGPSVRWAEILPLGEETVYYAAASTGLYSTRTLNGSSTIWSQEGASTIGNVVVDMVVSRQTDNLVVAGTHGNGVYSGTAQVTSIDDAAANHSIDGFHLSQNYPNPFNPATTIQYTVGIDNNAVVETQHPVETQDLASLQDVNLSVYNLLGQKIITLVNDRQPAGSYTLRWNGRDRSGRQMPSGTYIYRLTVGDRAQSRQMILLR